MEDDEPGSVAQSAGTPAGRAVVSSRRSLSGCQTASWAVAKSCPVYGPLPAVMKHS